MGKRRKKRQNRDSVTSAVDANQVNGLTSKSLIGFFLGDDGICPSGYTRLDQVPAIVAGYHRIAELAASLTIHLMENTADGDVRIQNELSRKIDINPSKRLTRSTWMEFILMNLFLYGKGNSVVRVKTRAGILQDLQPIPAARVQLIPDATGYDYEVMIDGVRYSPDDVLHFVYNPDPNYPWKGRGMQIVLQDLAENLRQAAATEKGFMKSEWKPSLIVKIDALTEEFASPEGRRKLLNDYITTGSAGEPWMVPAGQIDIEQIKPLSLSDLAINDNVKMDTRTVAAIIGVPAFLLGVGEYNQQEWNNFVNTRLRPLLIGIQQEMTRKLIISEKWYLRFNAMSLMDYDLQTIAAVFTTLQDRGDVTGNEVRDRIGLSPREGLDELKILENYIPADMSGNQSKLIQND